MSRAAKTYECFACGHVSASVREDMAHATSCPEAGGTITRAVACWACANPIDLRKGPACTDPDCDFVYPVERFAS